MPVNGGSKMATKQNKSEETVSKPRQVDVLVAQDQSPTNPFITIGAGSTDGFSLCAPPSPHVPISFFDTLCINGCIIHWRGYEPLAEGLAQTSQSGEISSQITGTGNIFIGRRCRQFDEPRMPEHHGGGPTDKRVADQCNYRHPHR